MKRHLILIVKLALDRLKFEFDDNACIVKTINRKIVARLPREGSLYIIFFTRADRFMCLETIKTIKCHDVVFVEATCDDANVKMHSSKS